ncbi:MAG: TldD/PmbA family protein [Armatimonadetes bacterium]|nr:TldD/PmbA family protein [Armatimonadota bacterium]
MMHDQQVRNAAQAAVEAAIAAGAEWADAAASSSRSVDVSAERNTLRESSVSYSQGVGVRAFYAGGVGMAHTDRLDIEAVREAGRQAAELARSASPDPDFHCLPDPQPLPDDPGTFDEKLAEMPAEQLVQWWVKALEQGQRKAEHVFIGGGAGVGAGVSAIASSTGILASAQGTAVFMYVVANVWDGDQAASFVDYASARQLADLHWEHLPEQVVERAASLVHDKPVTTGRRDLVLDFQVAYDWVRSLIGSANAESIQRNRSFLIDKEGQRIASNVLTVVEDPLIPAGLSSAAWDGEGVPRQRRVLLDAGVLTTYLHNSYTANKAGVAYTGHASRSGSAPHVGIAPSNLLIQPGDKSLTELIADITDGVFVVSGAPIPNPITGQVSSTIDAGYLIRDGEIAHPVKGAMVAGDIFDLLAAVDAVSSDFREDPGAIKPAVRLRDVMISAE